MIEINYASNKFKQLLTSLNIDLSLYDSYWNNECNTLHLSKIKSEVPCIHSDYENFIAGMQMQLNIYGLELFPASGVHQMLARVPAYTDKNADLPDTELFANTKTLDIRINRDDFLTHFNPNRLMIASDSGGSCSMYMDFNPSEYGNQGQIIVHELFGGNGSIEFVIADNFQSLLSNWIHEIDNGSYTTDEDNELIFAPNGDSDFWITDKVDYFVDNKFLKYIN